MAIEFVDSFDHYKLGNSLSDAVLFAELDAKWTSHAFELDVVSTGRTGQGLTIQWGSYIFKTLAHRAFWSTVFAFRINSGNGGGSLYTILNNGTPLFSLNYNFDHTLSLYAGSVLIAVTTQTVNQTKYNHVGVDVTFSGTTNITATVDLYLNGEKILAAVAAASGINQNTLLSGDTTGNVHMLGPGLASTGNTTIDDFVVCNGAADTFGGALNHSYIGDVKLFLIVPNADVTSGWTTATGGAAHYTQINEVPPDGDTTYIEDDTAGHKDIWDWQNISGFVGIIVGLQFSLYARKTDEGSKVMTHRVGPAGAKYTGALVWLSDDYVYHHMPLDADPLTGFRYSVTTFNAEQFGVFLEA
jgi:hypothetical protein